MSIFTAFKKAPSQVHYSKYIKTENEPDKEETKPVEHPETPAHQPAK